jgi:hypothetical protein
MHEMRSVAEEATEDIFFGQVVIVWARWFLIAAGIILTLWTTSNEAQMVLGMIPVVGLMGLMGLNFLIHGRYLAQRPANPAMITLASLLDLTVVTVILFWSDRTGLASQLYIFYYPVVLAFAFVMPRKVTVPYTIVALVAYTTACLVADASVFVVDVGDVGASALNVGAVKTLLLRLITIGAMGGLGTYYWRIQRNRRRAAMGGTPLTRNQVAGS